MNIGRITPTGEVLGDHRCKIVLVPASQIAFFEIELPTNNRAQAQKLASFALEEQLADDIENLHFCVQRKGDHWLVAVVSLETLDDWMDALTKHTIIPKALIPDAMAMTEDIDVLEEPHQFLIRNLRHHDELSSNEETINEDQNKLVKWFRNKVNKVNKAEHPIAFGVCLPLLPMALSSHGISEAQLDQLNCFFSKDYQELAEKASNIPNLERHSINLLRGYADEISLKPWLMPWLKPVIFVLSSLILVTVYLALSNHQLESQIETARRENRTLFARAFPDISRIVNLRTQAEAKFQELQRTQQLQSGSLINLLNLTIPVLEQNTGISVNSIRFSQFTMQLELTADQVGSLEKVIQSLTAKADLKVEVDMLEKRNEQALARIQVRINI